MSGCSYNHQKPRDQGVPGQKISQGEGRALQGSVADIKVEKRASRKSWKMASLGGKEG